MEYKDVKQSMTAPHACRGQAGNKNHDVAGKETKGNGGSCREMESTGPLRGIANRLFLNSVLATLLGSGFSRFVTPERRKRGRVCKHFCGGGLCRKSMGARSVHPRAKCEQGCWRRAKKNGIEMVLWPGLLPCPAAESIR